MPNSNDFPILTSVCVIGGGSWGTALAHCLAEKGHVARMVMRDRELAAEFNATGQNSRYLPGVQLNPGISATVDPGEALAGARICLLAVPCQHMRAALSALAGLIPQDAFLVCASKGVELGTHERMSEVVESVLPGSKGRYAILSGPSFAKEVAEGKPSAVVLGCADQKNCEYLRDVFSSCAFRVYSSQDVAGVELGGAFKNVVAIAAGVCDGLGLGNNARAALITRGLAEMSRLGQALGASPSTFMGLSGMGDLVLTCTGDLSRNRQVGLRLAAGEGLDAIVESMRMVAEGVKSTRAICELGEKHNCELPIASSMNEVLSGSQTPLDAVRNLMTRALKDECV